MKELFVVQSYSAGRRGAMRPDVPIQARDLGHAREVAKRLAVRKALVVAFMRKGDDDTGEWDDAKLIEAIGANIPEEVLEMERA
ncbi:MAG TPA: hypothetical protein VMF90_12240 [Rhizobiaceae bacterium]|nr:hypothetical protein [Rhizobiaceae bacterium]